MFFVFYVFRVGDEAADNSVDPKFLDADKAIVAQVRKADAPVEKNALSLCSSASVLTLLRTYSSKYCTFTRKRVFRRNTFDSRFLCENDLYFLDSLSKRLSHFVELLRVDACVHFFFLFIFYNVCV